MYADGKNCLCKKKDTKKETYYSAAVHESE